MTFLRRQPAGTPAGGQFATTGRSEAAVTLLGDVPSPDGLDALRSHLNRAGIDAAVHRVDATDGKTHAELATAAGESYTVAYGALDVYVTHPASGNTNRLTRPAWDAGFTAADVPRALASLRQCVAALRTWEALAGPSRDDAVTYSHVEVDDHPEYGRTATVWAKVAGTTYELRATTRVPGHPAQVTVADGGRELAPNKALDVLEVVGRAHGNHVSPGWHAADMLRRLHEDTTTHPEWMA